MNLNIFNGLPHYVRITILAQIRRLLSYSLFGRDDKEDLLQDLLLFYIDRFGTVPKADEALVVHAIRQYASNLIVKRHNRKDFLNSSLADFENANGEFSLLPVQPKVDGEILLRQIADKVNDREKQVLRLILEGYSLNQISAKLHIHKTTLKKLFVKMQNFLK